MKKKTHAEFIEQLKSISPDVIVLGQYTGSHNHIEVQCTSCNKVWSPTPHDLLSGKSCKSCKMKLHGDRVRKTHSQFINELSQITTDIEVLEEYKTRHTPVKVRCLVCGHEWDITPGDLLTGYGCRKCANKKNADNRRMSSEAFYARVAEINPNIEFLEEFQGANYKIQVRCKNCGRIWKTLAESILQGSGCVQCKKKEAGFARRKTHEQFETQISELHPDIILLAKYDGDSNPIKVNCKRCGRIWNADPSSLIQGFGCSRCSRSATSFMEQYLLHSFRKICGNDNVLSRDKTTINAELDIVIPSLKVAIEPGTWVYHKKIVEKDNLKRKKCTAIGYRLITIYDSYPVGEPSPFSTDCITVPYDLGQADHIHLQKLVKQLCDLLGIEIEIDTKCWSLIEEIAYKESKAKSTKEFIDEVILINPDVEILGHYRSSKSHILARCKICNHHWKPVSATLLRGGGCPHCGREKANVKIRKTHEDFLNDMTRAHPELTVVGKYHNSKTPIDVRCTVCGYEWATKPNTLLSGYGCPMCGRERTRQAVIKAKNNK